MQRFVLFFFLIINLFSATAQNLEQTFAFAEKEFKAGNYEIAEDAFQRVLFFDTEGSFSFNSYLALGQCKHELKKYSDAALSLSLAAATAPSVDQKTKAVLLSAHSNILAKQYNSAIFDLLSLPPLSDSIERKKNFYLGVSYFLWNDLKQSETYFLKTTSNTSEVKQIQEIFRTLNKKLRNPKVARLLSVFIPGSGQLYNGDIKNAVNSFLLTAALGVLFYYTSVNYALIDGYLAVFPWFQRYYLGGIRKAYNITETRNSLKKQKAYNELLSKFSY